MAASVPQINIPTSQTDPYAATAALPTAGQLDAMAPQPYQAFGDIPQVQAYTIDQAPYVSGAEVNPTFMAGVYNDLSALPGALQQSEQAVATALQPQFQQQRMGLDDNLASRGIVNSGAATYLNDYLSGQQDAALAGADVPLISQITGQYNQDLLANQQAGLFTQNSNQNASNQASAENQQSANWASGTSASLQNQDMLANQAAQNAAANTNAAFYGSTIASNEQNFNNFMNSLYGSAAGYGQGLEGSYLGSYTGPNSSVLGTMAGAPNAITQAGQVARSTAPNFGGAFGDALSGVHIGGSGGNNGQLQLPNDIIGVPNEDAINNINSPIDLGGIQIENPQP